MGLAVVTPGAAFVAASHVCPVTGVGSVRLLHWWSQAPTRSLPVPEPVAPLVASPHGSHLLAGGVSGESTPSSSHPATSPAPSEHTTASPSRASRSTTTARCSSPAATTAWWPCSCSYASSTSTPTPLAPRTSRSNRLPAHAAPVTCVACGHGGCNAVVATASMDGTCKVWTLTDGSHLLTITLPCTAFSLTLDSPTARLFAGSFDGWVHVASLNSLDTDTAKSSWYAGGNTSAALVGVGMANGCKNRSPARRTARWGCGTSPVACSVNTFRTNTAVTDVLVVKRSAGNVARARGGAEGFRVRDGEAWRKAGEVARMEQALARVGGGQD
ncbi:hypothetical protein GUJ93_ZPchr0009g532 [Zizania palustris]|uniref:Uncharacterized protein n=1 Tax=Zizania palustris TaxID=103762 RepID=A0A8J5RIM1_ZIZPA|nr:hypothetical protein GUJ93_ZPchr0009g532 [Zizania palustris]